MRGWGSNVSTEDGSESSAAISQLPGDHRLMAAMNTVEIADRQHGPVLGGGDVPVVAQDSHASVAPQQQDRAPAPRRDNKPDSQKVDVATDVRQADCCRLVPSAAARAITPYSGRKAGPYGRRTIAGLPQPGKAPPGPVVVQFE